MDITQALLQNEINEQALIEQHARAVFNIGARTNVSLQHLEAARKAFNRAKKLQTIPASHSVTKDRGFQPTEHTYGTWLQSWTRWVASLHPIQKALLLVEVHRGIQAVNNAIAVRKETDEYADAVRENDFEEQYQLLLNAVQETQNSAVWRQKLKLKFTKSKCHKGVHLVDFFGAKVLLAAQIKTEDQMFDDSPSNIYHTVLENVKGIKKSDYLTSIKNNLDGLDMNYRTDEQRDEVLGKMKSILERISTARSFREETSDTEPEPGVAAISNPACDYCASSKNSEIRAGAKECPGKFGKESEMINGERKIRNPKCPRLIAKRKQREEKKRKKKDGDNTNQRESKRPRDAENQIKCARCGKIGHMAKDCRRPDQRTCYKCNQRGHIARDCPREHTNNGGFNRGDNNQRRVNAIGRRDNTPAWRERREPQGWGDNNNQQGWGNNNNNGGERDRDDNHGWGRR
jgi:hypothetical protein